MKLDYFDICAFIEHIQEEALMNGKQLITIDELQEFLDDNPSKSITIIRRG